MNRAIIAILAVLAGVAASQGRIITVDDDGPADFNNIRAAIDDANDGDTVLVADGTYAGYGRSEFDCFCKFPADLPGLSKIFPGLSSMPWTGTVYPGRTIVSL